MFSENSRISDRQLARLAVLDWFGKGALLLQEMTRAVSVRQFFLYLLAGFLLVFFYLCLLCGLSGRLRRDGDIQRKWGKLGNGFLAATLLTYNFMNLVYILRLFGEIGNRFVLPEVSGEVLMLMAALAGAAAAFGCFESGARTASVIYPFVIWPLGLLILLSAFTVRTEYLGPGTAVLDASILPVAGSVFLVFAGAGSFLFAAPNVEGKPCAALKTAALRTFACLGALFLVMTGAFGEGGLKFMAWPVIALMSSAEIPGVFFQRWDVIFVGLLLMEMFISAGTNVYNLTDCGRRLWKKGGKGAATLWAGAGFLCALWCGTYERAMNLYLAVNGAAAVVLTLLAVIFWFAERSRQR